MKKITSRYLAAAGLATLLTPMVWAQPAGAANTAAQSATAAANAARTLPAAASATAQTAAQQSAAAANQSANASAQAAANSAARAAQFPTPNSPAVTGATSTAAGATIPTTPGTVNAGMATSADASVDRPVRNGVGVDARTDARANGTATAPGLKTDLTGSGNIATSLNTDATTLQIRNATADTRESVFKQVDSSLQATHVALAQLRQAGHDLRGDARQELNAAYEQVRTREQALRESLRSAQRATADQSADARAKLASDYAAYADAVAAAESAATVSATSKIAP